MPHYAVRTGIKLHSLVYLHHSWCSYLHRYHTFSDIIFYFFYQFHFIPSFASLLSFRYLFLLSFTYLFLSCLYSFLSYISPFHSFISLLLVLFSFLLVSISSLLAILYFLSFILSSFSFLYIHLVVSLSVCDSVANPCLIHHFISVDCDFIHCDAVQSCGWLLKFRINLKMEAAS